MAETAVRPERDERLARVNLLATLVKRPDLGAVVGAIAVFFLFAWTARGSGWLTDLGIASQWTDQAAQYGIVAVPVALLMIGGEFDLSAGVMVGSSGLLLGVLTAREGWNVWPAIVVVLLFGAAIGFINGYTVVRTRLPSFIVTLGTFFILQGVNAGGTLKLTGTVNISGIDGAPGFDSARPFFASSVWSPYDFKVKVIWWFGLVVLGALLLARTRFGNWIYAVGGDAVAARNIGVPVARTKIALFMMTSMTSALLGIITAIELRSIQANEGVGREFIFIIAAVVGGCLLTGGYGSVIGGAFGSAILGMASIGIILSQWDSNWVYAFQGVILMLAVMLNAAIPEPGREGEVEMSDVKHLLETRAISKFYGNVVALREISAHVDAGEVTCVLGDNGAGKSSFIKILSGVHQPDEGELLVDGNAVTFHSPRDARDLGIATVYQDLAMVPLMSIWRNFFLGAEPTKGRGPFKVFDVAQAKDVVRTQLRAMGIDIRDPDQPVGTLSGGERQSVAIARAVYFGARVLILDEPTSALGVKQAGVVLKYILQARERGVGVIFITHNPHHAYPVGDRFVILNRGQSIGSFRKDEIDQTELVRLMAGGSELAALEHELEQIKAEVGRS